MTLIRLGHIIPRLIIDGQEYPVNVDLVVVPDASVAEVLATHSGSVVLDEPHSTTDATDVTDEEIEAHQKAQQEAETETKKESAKK